MIAASTVMRYHQGSEMSGGRLCRGPGYDEKVIMTKGSVVGQREEKWNKMSEIRTKDQEFGNGNQCTMSDK